MRHSISLDQRQAALTYKFTRRWSCKCRQARALSSSHERFIFQLGAEWEKSNFPNRALMQRIRYRRGRRSAALQWPLIQLPAAISPRACVCVCASRIQFNLVGRRLSAKCTPLHSELMRGAKREKSRKWRKIERRLFSPALMRLVVELAFLSCDRESNLINLREEEKGNEVQLLGEISPCLLDPKCQTWEHKIPLQSANLFSCKNKPFQKS